jgi:two-component system response regulator AtoC
VSANLLFIEDDPLIRRSTASRLRTAGHRVREAETVAAARKLIADEAYDAAILDYRLPDGTGYDVLAELSQRQPGVPAIVMTAHASVALAVEAMRRGAFTYIEKPVDPDGLDLQLAKALETSELRQENARLRRLAEPAGGAEAFLGVSEVAERVREQIRRIGASPARAVLLDGESGTGKGLVARTLHAASPRAGKPFVSITCSAMPEQLLESELFGHESGAFTDARKRKIGLLEAAEGGTLFLDEIGDMAAPLQAKLLGVLEERRFRRVGGLQETDVDVRVVSATNRDLRKMVEEGKFREDLLYRLRVVPIRIPPLRERPEDVPLLAERFAEDISRGWRRDPVRISQAGLAALSRRPWPGNVRELRNAIERAVILATGDELQAADLVDDTAGPKREASGTFELPVEGVRVEDLVDDLVRQALDRTKGNQSAASRLLGLTRDQFRHRMQRLGLLPGTSPS